MVQLSMSGICAGMKFTQWILDALEESAYGTCRMEDITSQHNYRGPLEPNLINEKNVCPFPVYSYSSFSKSLNGKRKVSKVSRSVFFFTHSRSPSWVRDDLSIKLSLDETKYPLLYARRDICSTKKGALVLKTGPALKTKSGHKVIDLLELSSEPEIHLERNTTFSSRLSNSE